jgi:hypothetical protein
MSPRIVSIGINVGIKESLLHRFYQHQLQMSGGIHLSAKNFLHILEA